MTIENKIPLEGGDERQEQEVPDGHAEVFVRSLGDYNAGYLTGDWIDATLGEDHIADEIQSILKRSVTGPAEEWAIHDYQGFGGFNPHEYESIGRIAEVAAGIVEHGPAFGHWVQSIMDEADELSSFTERYRGHWKDLAEYAADMIDDLGMRPEELGVEWIRPFVSIDYEALGAHMSADLETIWADGGVYVFDAC